MWPFISPINLIRYLIVWRVNSSLVWLPHYLPAEISRVLGNIVADRLPTKEARPWRKALAPWEEAAKQQGKSQRPPPKDVAWPIESVLFAFSGKKSFGQGELIAWELKLLGDAADHGLFLELLLPAMEQAGATTDSRWRRSYGLWGHFEIQAMFAARGNRWEPFVQDGQLDLRYRATSRQWAEGLAFADPSDHLFDQIAWITPFDLRPQSAGGKHNERRRDGKIGRDEVPTTQAILDALLARMSLFLPGKHKKPSDVLASLSEEERANFERARTEAALIPVQRYQLSRPRKSWPGRWIGKQRFPIISPTALPYLELASILHIGKQTHLGCGSFVLD